MSPQSLTEGVVLSVTAQVSAEGIIHMSLNPSITERTGVATSRLGDTVPIVSVRETDTLVRVREGETVVIAGLMQDRTTNDVGKVPLLGDLPGVGGLFRRSERSRTKTDLVILLTPTILGPGTVAENAAAEIRRIDTARAASEREALMYEQYYGFAEKPFSLTPDPKYLYRSESHADALELLQYAIERREGFVVITGDIGTGKTTLCRALLEQTDNKTFTALLLNPFLSEEDLLKAIAAGSRRPVARRRSRRAARAADQAGPDQHAATTSCCRSSRSARARC